MSTLTRAFVFIALLLASTPAMWADGASPTITVMTQNMDAGTDLQLAFAYLNTSTPTVGIDLTYQEIQQSNFTGRAAILAQQIAAAKPHLVSLQEATVWSTGPDPLHQAPFVDQLQLLLGSLAALGEDYLPVDVIQLTTTALPMSNGVWLGLMDRNAVLVRNNSGLSLANIRKGLFAARVTIPTTLGDINVLEGWIAADVTFGGNTFTFVDTHLESTFPGQPLLNQIQVAQAQELAALFPAAGRIVIAGDFNSNATHTPPERTPSVAVVLGAGYTDSWPVINRGNPGFTWPLYVEDPFAHHPEGPFERIDFVFERGFGIQSVDRLGWKAPHASDHTGVIATLRF
jgi:Endonuclease/Exonuclease/phosphatase family